MLFILCACGNKKEEKPAVYTEEHYDDLVRNVTVTYNKTKIKAPFKFPQASNLSNIYPATAVKIMPPKREIISFTAEKVPLSDGETNEFPHLKHIEKIRYLNKYAKRILIVTKAVLTPLPNGRKGTQYINMKKKILIVSKIITIFFVLIFMRSTKIDMS